jgi:hypothetical protein
MKSYHETHPWSVKDTIGQAFVGCYRPVAARSASRAAEFRFCGRYDWINSNELFER